MPGQADDEPGEYWLPWHIDSNFVTLIHKELYAYESDASFAPEPEEAGIVFMNEDGDVAKGNARDDALIFQIGAFAQIYAGGHIKAGRHAVLTPRPPGIARFNFCNFWYVPWDTLCEAPPGMEHQAITRGWNSMMDESYLDISQKNGFAAFRQFMTSPEARVQFANTEHFMNLAELLPMPARSQWPPAQLLADDAGTRVPAQIVIDVLTDVRCPISYLAKLNLDKAMQNLSLEKRFLIRYHPVFLDPNVPKEGESLDDYLLRDYGYTKEYAHSEDYPLRKAGLEVGVRFNPERRVVNTFDAFCALDLAEEKGLQDQLFEELSRRYFQGAEDLSEDAVLFNAAEAVGLGFGERAGASAGNYGEAMAEAHAQFREAMTEARARVMDKYESLTEKINEVPHFFFRERTSGKGVELGGRRTVAEWESILQETLAKSQFMGMSVPGPQGKDVWMSEANPKSPVSHAFPAQHGWAPSSWPFTDEDFGRLDETPDNIMYSAPRLVNHLDNASIGAITEVYRSFFRAVPPRFAALDLCSSWVSHYPSELLEGARIVVHGLNGEELDYNAQATERHVQDLNLDPSLPWGGGSFDFVTLALSVQYLTKPREVFAEMHRVLKPGGMAVAVFSNRCFIEKTVDVWAKEVYDCEGHALILRKYLLHSTPGGWAGLSSMDVSPSDGDPVWVVTAVKQ